MKNSLQFETFTSYIGVHQEIIQQAPNKRVEEFNRCTITFTLYTSNVDSIDTISYET